MIPEGENPDVTLAELDESVDSAYLGESEKTEISEPGSPPDGWMAINPVAKEIGVSGETVRGIVEEYREDHPEWFGIFERKNRQAHEFFHPRLVELVTERCEEDKPPEDWLSSRELADRLEADVSTIRKVASKQRDEHPEWFETFKQRRSQGEAEHYHPDLVAVIETERSRYGPPPEGWVTIPELGEESSRSHGYIRERIERYLEDHPEWSQTFRTERGQLVRHLHPELAEVLREHFDREAGLENAPDGWMTQNALANELKRAQGAVKRSAECYREEHPEWFREFKNVAGTDRRPRVFYSPELVEQIRQDVGERVVAPEGWLTKPQLQKLYGWDQGVIARRAAEHLEKHPEWARDYGTAGHPSEYYHPDLIVAIRNELEIYDEPPEGWITRGALAKKLGRDWRLLGKRLDSYREEHPEQFGTFFRKGVLPTEYFSPDVASLMEDEYGVFQAPDGWITMTGLAKSISIPKQTVGKFAETFREERPEWFRRYRPRGRVETEYYSPDLVQKIKDEFSKEPPKDWMSTKQVQEELGVSQTVALTRARHFQEQRPELIQKFRDETGHRTYFFSPELVSLLRKESSTYASPPEGWLTVGAAAEQLEVADGTIYERIRRYEGGQPDWFSFYRSEKAGRAAIYCSPEFLVVIEESIRTRHMNGDRKAAQKELQESLGRFIEDVARGETLEAQKFRALVELFGSERTTDILYQYRPEYQSIPVPEVRNILSDYLGEYFVMQGGLRLENLELATDYLSNPSLKDALSEVVKRDGLRTYNRIKREYPGADEREVLTGYARLLERETAHLENADLDEVVEQLDAYYKALFEIPKPDSLVGGIDPDRQFPDVNQRINIIELAHKNKMLIADEMGLGKSASAILAKESLGVDQALVVVPSNVIDVWKTYLSDKRGEDGEILGYFKEGRAPRVLVIDGNEFPEGIDPAGYDYVIVSQEGLTEERVELLQQFDYDMMIVDEIHKLKNLSAGVRAEQLVRLAEKINGSDDKYLALLSGTPVPNKVSDVAMLLKLLYPEKFEDVPNKQLVREIIAGDAINLRSLLLPRMELKSLTESIDMPELTEEIHEIELSPEERELYDIFLEEDELTAAQKMQYMRQFILNPRLLDGTPGVEGTKIREVSESLRKTFVGKDKVVMFVNGYVEGVIRGDFDIFDELDLPDDVIVHVIDGSVSKRERREIENELRQPGQRVLLAVSGQTADVGVDFTAGEEVYFYNDPWTEYDKRQQLGRVFRPGHEGELVARSFYARGTIEEGIRRYIKLKYQAIEKLLHGIPTSEIEKRLLEEDEKQAGPTLEVNPELARYYFSSWDRMLKIYGHVKEQGEAHFEKFLSDYGETYAESYRAVGNRSYQSNANRLAGALIHMFVKQRRKLKGIRIVDMASGPDMLRRHMPDRYAEHVTSVDINPNHFAQQDDRHVVASYRHMPFEDGSVDYANLALSLHYTSFRPSQSDYERIEVLREMNRILKLGGRGVVSLMYTMDLRDPDGFAESVRKLGFKVVEEYSGVAEAGNAFRSRVITLEKVDDCPQDAKELTDLLGPEGRRSLKFAKSKSTLRDSRRIVTRFEFAGRDRDSHVDIDLSKGDKALYRAEQAALARMEELKDRYGEIADIPADEIISQGLSRVYNGRRYVLFQRLEGNQGAVVVK